jgi:hypothetical protein
MIISSSCSDAVCSHITGIDDPVTMWHTLAKELDGATTRTTNHLPKLHEDETRSRTTDRRVLHHPYQLLEPNHWNHGRYGFIYSFILISRKHRSSLGVMGPKEEQTKETSSRPPRPVSYHKGNPPPPNSALSWEEKDPGGVRMLPANPRWERRFVKFLGLSRVGRVRNG